MAADATDPAAPVATVNSEPPMLVATPAPLVASVNASPPAEVTIVNTLPPTARMIVSNVDTLQTFTCILHFHLQVTSVKTLAAPLATSVATLSAPEVITLTTEPMSDVMSLITVFFSRLNKPVLGASYDYMPLTISFLVFRSSGSGEEEKGENDEEVAEHGGQWDNLDESRSRSEYLYPGAWRGMKLQSGARGRLNLYEMSRICN